MPESAQDLYNQLTEFVLRRYRTNARRSMRDVYEVDQTFIQLEKDNLEFIYKNRAGVISILADPKYSNDLAQVFVKSSLEFTYNNNQYIHLDTSEQHTLFGLYQSYLQGMKAILQTSPSFTDFERDFSRLVQDHFYDLSRNISRFFDRETGWQVQENIILKQVVCSEYSPDFQLHLLGLNLDDLREPVLDLGCGKNGPLIGYLREKGIKALGVDRLVENIAGLKEVDWFDIDFKPRSWGTVLSHMAFSNHFLFQHRYKYGQPHRYARLYMNILHSLIPGGSFVYTPGLPFIETYLPADQFSVTRQGLASKDQPQNDNVERPVVTRVTRLASGSTGSVGQ